MKKASTTKADQDNPELNREQLGVGVRGKYFKQFTLKEYLVRHDDEEITRRLDEVYERESSAVDPALSRIAAGALPNEKWK